jgi:UDP-N-acetylmuramyl pentapeptide phosphotransferase/UDP-N-acetylglucosamine-1-phosphate transferase
LIVVFIFGFFVSLAISLVVIRFSHKYDLFIDCHVREKPQKFHHRSVPRAGGIAIFVVSFILSLWFDPRFLPGIVLVFISGIFEDLHNSFTPRIRLFLQIGAAISTVFMLDTVVTYLGLGVTLPYTVGVVFSIFAIVGMINAVNIIDGFNGLASGIVLMIVASFWYEAFLHGEETLMYLLSGIGGAIAGFFVLVFPGGKIFLGDGGAYLLGFIVAVIGILLAGKYADISPWYVLAMFIYPVWEVLFSIVRKLSKGMSPFKPDRCHFHMLVHRHISKNNPLTALFILCLNVPFMWYATAHANCSRCNLYVVLVFIAVYLSLYVWMYRKERLAAQ